MMEYHVEGVLLPYPAQFDLGQAKRILAGWMPENLEDRRLVVYEAPYLFFHRSWTGLAVYRLELHESADGVAVFKALWSTDIAKSASEDVLARETIVLDRLLRQLLLGETPLPAPEPEGEPEPAARRHSGPPQAAAAAAAANAQRVALPTGRPWWRFWG